ncbi:MAG TPA: sigma-70 family RNA polymerase sigma factor [Thermoanaerobaculia bacterium]|jgi:RNA polymerase sigma-70 factor (ECF subfamily)|nr:sigma-70 family RNA polymerase sigma factor [Thermoanaerobaculia bacterium]
MAMTDDLVPGDMEGQRLGETPEELFRRYYRPVVAFFQGKGFSTEESRDLAQETFYRVHKYRDGFRGDSSVETWLFQIAANLYKNTLRSQATQKRDMQEVSLDISQGEPQPSDLGPPWGNREENPLKALLTEERTQKLRDALNGLPPQMKLAVLLRVDRDLKYREIADLMRVSIETVKAHLYQARQHLRAKLADYFTDEEF